MLAWSLCVAIGIASANFHRTMICQPGEFCYKLFCTRWNGRPSASVQADIQFRTAASGRAVWPIGYLVDSRGPSWTAADDNCCLQAKSSIRYLVNSCWLTEKRCLAYRRTFGVADTARRGRTTRSARVRSGVTDGRGPTNARVRRQCKRSIAALPRLSHGNNFVEIH